MSPNPVEMEIAKWRQKRWPKPGAQGPWVGIKIAEEAGEVLGCITKIQEGRATEDDLRKELGDLLIAVSALAGPMGWSLEELRADRWADVSQR